MAYNKQTKDCELCGKEFVRKKRRSLISWNLAKYCSAKCRSNKDISEETRIKMRDSHLGKKYKPMSNLGKLHLSISHKGKKQTIESIQKRKESNSGFRHNEETKKKISKLRTGKGNGMFGKKPWNWKGGYERELWRNRLYRASKRNAKGSHTLEEWSNLKKQYNYTCPCCKRQEPEIKLTLDHIIPLSKGGSDYIENIQPLCKPCNSRKNNRYIIKYDK